MNLIWNKYERTIKISIFILGYYFTWQLLSFITQACAMWQQDGQWPLLFQLVTSWGSTHISSMFCKLILKEGVGYVSLRLVDISHHSHTRSWLWNLKRYILNASFHIFSVGFSVYTYPSTFPTNKTCVGSPETNEEDTILLITQPAPPINFHCIDSNLMNTKATTSTHPHYHYYCHQKLSPNAQHCEQKKFQQLVSECA